MDLGLAGRRALVCAASKGLGRGCAQALADAGCVVTIVARTEAEVRRTADEIGARAGHPVAFVAADITTPEGRAAALAACGEPDILINNAGGPPPGDFRDWDRAAWLRAIDANMLTPIELIKATVDGMIARKFGRIVNITSSAVKAPIDVLGLSNGARSGLTGFVAGIAWFLCPRTRRVDPISWVVRGTACTPPITSAGRLHCCSMTVAVRPGAAPTCTDDIPAARRLRICSCSPGLYL